MKKIKTINNNQQGFVSFFVTIMVMIIFGILILSFSQISNREGVSALNRDLSTNALYAAESGINDAYTSIRNELSGSLPSSMPTPPPTTFNYTGANQTYTVPGGINSISVNLYGAKGGGGNDSGYYPGGFGGQTTGTLSVYPGEVLTIVVAGSGTQPSSYMNVVPGGFGGGGTSFGSNSPCCGSGSGGGASQILNGTTELAVAGGGGGTGAEANMGGGGIGGSGGGGAGATGLPVGSLPTVVAGTGGTASSGGTGGTNAGYGGNAGNNGGLGIGGAGAAGSGTYGDAGGGGGGGYYGGGGGGGGGTVLNIYYYPGGPGGGGSGLIPAGGGTTSIGGAQSINTAQSGNGQVIITPLYISPSPSPLNQTSSCSPSSYGNPILDSSTQYTCVLVSSSPSTLSYLCPSFCPNNSILSLIQSSGNPINNLTIKWSDSNITGSSGCSTLNPLPFFSYSNWPTNCQEMLRVDLVPFTSGTTTLNTLNSGVKTFFLYPQPSAAGAQSFTQINSTNVGTVYPANCSTPPNCSFTVQGLDSYGTTFYARIQYYYGTSPSISMTGTDTNGLPISFTGSQLQIDATGLSGTVLKRVSANIATNGSDTSPYSLPLPPNDALQSTDSICKSFFTYQSNLYEIIPSSKPGDINSAISPGTEINTSNNSDFCNPI